MTKLAFLREVLLTLESAHLSRLMRTLDSPQRAHVTCDGRDLLMLASNSYLDLSGDPDVKTAAAQAVLEWGVGSGGSRLTTGNTGVHEQLETALARFKGSDAALIFNTGYMANVGIISSLCGQNDAIFSDELNHASLIDGCRLSKANVHVYRHNDMSDLERAIRDSGFDPSHARGLVISDAVFSMDGDVVNLPQLMGLAEKYHLLSMIDEAHATGVLGATGRGTVEYYGLQSKPDILMGTLSKALGAEGGFVCGSRDLIEFLKHRARSFIFSTALAPASTVAARTALEILERHPERVQSLRRNIECFCDALAQEGIPTQSQSAIVPIIIGDEQLAVSVSQRLFADGYFISAIRYPTVAKGKARLRVALMSSHTETELRGAARAIARALRQERELTRTP